MAGNKIVIKYRRTFIGLGFSFPFQQAFGNTAHDRHIAT